MRYMIIEQFREDRIGEVYSRFAKNGRTLPEGLRCVGSWVSADLRKCFRLR